MSFDEWLDHVFDHPVADPEWYWDDALDEVWENYLSADAVLKYFTRLLLEPTALAKFTREQVAQGLWFLLSGVFLVDALDGEPDVSPEQGDRFLDAIVAFFRNWVMQQELPSGSQGTDPLAVVLYMWWDIWEWGEVGSRGKRLAAVRDILALPCGVCRESSLHGLGHWRETATAEEASAIEAVIDQFLNSASGITDALLEYASNARRGHVL